MPRLISRQRQIPGGVKFYQAATKWASTPWASFDSVVNSLISHRKGNPALTEKHGWSTDYETVANEVDEFNAHICESMNWKDYITGGGGAQPAPFSSWQGKPLGNLPNIVAGAKVLVDWINSGAEAVPIQQAESRAAICVKCPKNEKGDWTRFFTVPVSEAIRAELEKRRGWNLSTSHDNELRICGACLCPLKLKVHVPIDKINARISDEARANLDSGCWIRSESK